MKMKTLMVSVGFLFLLSSASNGDSGRKYLNIDGVLVAKSAIGDDSDTIVAVDDISDPEVEYEERSREFRNAYALHLEELRQSDPKDRHSIRKAWIEARTQEREELRALARKIAENKAERRSHAAPMALESQPLPASEMEGKSKEDLRKLGVKTEALHQE